MLSTRLQAHIQDTSKAFGQCTWVLNLNDQYHREKRLGNKWFNKLEWFSLLWDERLVSLKNFSGPVKCTPQISKANEPVPRQTWLAIKMWTLCDISANIIVHFMTNDTNELTDNKKDAKHILHSDITATCWLQCTTDPSSDSLTEARTCVNMADSPPRFL